MKDPTTLIYHDGIGAIDYVDHMGSDERIVDAARVSFNRTGGHDAERDAKLIRYLLQNRHTSPFEHCSITWRFTVPLFVRSQHHRHRTWAFNEVSRRYTSENLQFYVPQRYRTQHAKDRQASNMDAIDPLLPVPYMLHLASAAEVVAKHVQASVGLYNAMLNAGIAREQARMVLPQNLYTQYYGTVSLHNAFHFLRLRLDEHAQWEIRRVAEAMLAHLRELFPVATAAFDELVFTV